MKAKVFNIRLTKENFQTDQENLNNFLESISVRKTEADLITGQPNFWSILVFYEDQQTEKQEITTDKITVSSYTELTEDEKSIFETLKQWRNDKASQMNIPNFMVCHNTELMTIARLKPKTLYDFSIIKGFGRKKIANLGDDIISVLNSITSWD